MNTRKTAGGLVLLAGVTGFAFQFGHRQAEATTPNPCPLQPCRDVYGWWVEGSPGGTKCFAAEIDHTDQNGGPNKDTHDTYGVLNIYAVVSNGNKQDIVGKIDKYIYPDHSQTCGKENGKWQSPQEVAPAGKGTYDGWPDKRKCAPITGTRL